MFLDEARLSLHLSHANIVSVFDIGKSDSTYFIVMEYVDGTNLKAILEHQSRHHPGQYGLPPPLALWMLNEILKGLDYAHRLTDPETQQSLGIVHRDISPPNILVSWNGEVKLTDFGLAKAATQLESTDPGVVKGKFSYLAPEAAHGQPVDHRADIFAVGILAFEMMTGRRLFLGETDYQTVELIRRAEVPSMRAINPDIPEELENVIRKALARDVTERFQTANEFADELLAILFSRRWKVSARDCSNLLREMRHRTPPPADAGVSKSNLIMKLIDDELVNFRSLDEDSGNTPPTGSRPLDLSGGSPIPTQYDPSAPLQIEDFAVNRGSEHSGIPSRPAEPTVEGQTDDDEDEDDLGIGDAPPAAAQQREASLTPWLVLLGVLLAGGGAYYWLVVLGNLQQLTG